MCLFFLSLSLSLSLSLACYCILRALIGRLLMMSRGSQSAAGSLRPQEGTEKWLSQRFWQLAAGCCCRLPPCLSLSLPPSLALSLPLSLSPCLSLSLSLSVALSFFVSRRPSWLWFDLLG